MTLLLFAEPLPLDCGSFLNLKTLISNLAHGSYEVNPAGPGNDNWLMCPRVFW